MTRPYRSGDFSASRGQARFIRIGGSPIRAGFCKGGLFLFS
jgi:hypothetical protein